MAGMETGTERNSQKQPTSQLTGNQWQPATTRKLRMQVEQQLAIVWNAVGDDDTLAIDNLSSEELEAARMVTLLHDLHKVFPGEGFEHYSLPAPLKEADAVASRMAREKTFTRMDFDKNNNRLRYSLVTRTPLAIKIPETRDLLKGVAASSARELHQLIARSKDLALINEARANPFTSLKHHLLLTCALVENFIETGRTGLQGLVLCVDITKPENEFKIIGVSHGSRNKRTAYWLWLDNHYCNGGNSHLFLSFKDTWTNMVGIDSRTIRYGRYLSAVNSWTAALAMLEMEARY